MKGTGPWIRALSSSVASRIAVWNGDIESGGFAELCTSKESGGRWFAERYSSILEVLTWIMDESSEILLSCDILCCGLGNFGKMLGKISWKSRSLRKGDRLGEPIF
jgi:hypothetical protein